MPIHLLPPQLANQIAAGEVVERPASVVKELVENSLDAGATRIELDIERGGHKRIRLKDDGCGIAKDELELALSRHATSKISSLSDLEQILSLGFRGEALASISSVSRLTLTSRPENQQQAWQAYCEGSQMAVRVQPAAHPKGTTIDVADLFYNTPARRKFLRTEKTEFQHIEETVKRIALSHPSAAFVLRHNGKTVKRYPGGESGNHEPRIASVLGKKFIQNAIYLDSEYDGLQITAWLGNQAMIRSSTDHQFSFVNGRGMRDKLILHAIRQAYESVWGVVEQPAFVVYLKVDPRDVDVNVHPAKNEVRFQRSRLVHDFICKAVCEALDSEPQQAELGSSSAVEAGSQKTAVHHGYIRPLQSVAVTESGQQYSFGSAIKSSGWQGARTAVGAGSKVSSVELNAQQNAHYTRLMTPGLVDPGHAEGLPSFIHLGENFRIYQKNSTYWLLSIHPVLAQMLLEQIRQASTRQPLLMPVAIPANGVEETNLDLLRSSGFEIDKAAGKLRLLQVPAGCRHFPWITMFPAMLEKPVADFEALVNIAVEGMDEWPQDIQVLSWQWLESLPVTKQWEWIREFGKVRQATELLDWWQQQ
ncbi:DNA mismatch repair endonuclease MutL [Alteromonas aestuariivivens]|uniref:DNA mismatch repair protein MutL n=1 Tax=Alteromonas aestuariivivens TaxID=1938339 RepID=A0A3D8M7C0_9ALTE|nr:DNA mismatch repair endonuclease MutL [Alteromonas aestuariivivens]RDV25625.1 DNA mismatch repair endonuclease MutL [Alteromonas aestuariivivens]